MRLKPVLAALAFMALSLSAKADILTFAGDTTGKPTYTRLLADLSAPSAIGTAVHYSAFVFSVNTSGTYTFLTTASFDAMTFLYKPLTLEPASLLSQPLIGNDDLLGTTTSGFSTALTAGVYYAHITTGYANGDFGQFSTTIGGPGAITAVPEPQSYLLMLAGIGFIGGIAARRRSRASA